jgi:hypothetical protein
MKELIEVDIIHFGVDPVTFLMGSEGYMVHGSREAGVVAFYVDAWTETGRAWPISTSTSVYFVESKTSKNFPTIQLTDNSYESEDTSADQAAGFAEIYFPEFEGWCVHSVCGGKTMSICLVKSEY